MQENTLIERLQTARVLTADGRWRIKPASGGHNTQVYFLDHPDRETSLTVRLARAGIDLQREAGYLALLGDCPGIPIVRHVEPDLLVHDTLPGTPAPLADATDADLNALAQVLACIHAHEVDHYIVWPHLTERRGTRADLLLARITSLPEYRSFDDSLRDDLLALYQALRQIELDGPGWHAMQFAMIHGDLSIGNILWSEAGVSLIDWEYTRPSDPAEELAYLITEQPVPENIVQRLRGAYIAHGGPPDAWERLPAWLPFTALDSAFWWCDHLRERGEDPAGHPEVQARIETTRRFLG